MFRFDDIDAMSQDELAAAWHQLGQRLAAKGDEWLRQALECAFAATQDQEEDEATDEGYQHLAERFMADVQALIDNDGSELLRVVVQGFQWPDSIVRADLSLHELCRRMFSMIMVTDALGEHYLGAMYGGAKVDANEYAPALSVQYEDFNPGLRSGIGALHEAASEMLARGPTLERTAKLWAARVTVGQAYRPLGFEGIGVIYWAARRLIPTSYPVDGDASEDRSSTTSAAMPVVAVQQGVRSGFSQYDVFMASVTTEMAELLGVPERMGERVARRVRFKVQGKRRVLRLRVRVVTQGDRRIEVCLVSTAALSSESEPYPSGLNLEIWERSSQIFTGFRIPFHMLDYVAIRPLVSSALRYLARYAATLS